MKKLSKALSLILSAVLFLTCFPIGGLVYAKAESTAVKITDLATGDKFNFGSYPQSEVTDSATKSQLNNMSKTWRSYGYFESQNTPGDYMQYCDIDLDGDSSYDYRGVQFSKYRPYYTTNTASSTAGTNQDDYGYSLNTVYWFRYEPLTWRVLDAETGLVMCESIIDSQAYNDYEYYYEDGKYTDGNSYKSFYFNDSSYTNTVNKWETSSIRSWLNETFYNTAYAIKLCIISIIIIVHHRVFRR